MSYSADFLNICCDVLYEGNEEFRTDLGVVACIVDGVYEVVAVVPPSGLFRPGDTHILESTLSQLVYDAGEIVILTEYGGELGLRKHPLYTSLGAEFFVGAPIVINNQVWGTLAFSSREIRTDPVTPSALRILAAGANEIAAAFDFAHEPGARAQMPVAAPATSPAATPAPAPATASNIPPQAPSFPPHQVPVSEDEPAPGRIIPLPLPGRRPQTPAARF